MKIKDILGKVDNVVVEINKLAGGEDERLLQLAIDMFGDMAGWSSDSDYKKYINEEVENV